MRSNSAYQSTRPEGALAGADSDEILCILKTANCHYESKFESNNQMLPVQWICGPTFPSSQYIPKAQRALFEMGGNRRSVQQVRCKCCRKTRHPSTEDYRLAEVQESTGLLNAESMLCLAEDSHGECRRICNFILVRARAYQLSIYLVAHV